MFLFRILLKSPLTIVFLIVAASSSCYSQISISKFSPIVAKPGETVSILGGGFSGIADSNTVFFGPVKGQVLSSNNAQLNVVVPLGCMVAKITVISQGMSATSNQDFIPTYIGNNDNMLYSNSFEDFGYINKETITDPGSIMVSDFDNDGLPDVLCIDKSNGITQIFRNVCSKNLPAFEKVFSQLLPNGFIPLIIADIDADGRKDIVLCKANSDSSSIAFFMNTSTTASISFNLITSVTINGYLSSIVPADFDKDGKVDLVFGNVDYSNVLNYKYQVTLFKNVSTTTTIKFAQLQTLDTNIDYSQFDCTDFDGDGKLELVFMSHFSSHLDIVQLATTNGIFSLIPNRSFPFFAPKSFRIVDLDLDGKNDLIVQSIVNDLDGLSFVMNTSTAGNLNFANPIDTSCWLTDYEFADMNGDKKLDIVFSDNGIFEQYYNQISLNTGNAGASYSDFIAFPSTSAFEPIVCDMNNDGNPDILGIDPPRRNEQQFGGIGLVVNKIKSPSIIGFSPERSFLNDTIYIKGRNLINTDSVYISGVAAKLVSSNGDSILTVIVPQTISGTIAVKTSIGTAEKEGFIYGIRPPVITGIYPDKAKIRDTILVKGSRFKPNIDSNIVYVGDLRANVLNADTNTLKIIVPPGTVYSKIFVTTAHQTCESQQSFDPIFDAKDSTFNLKNFFLTYQKTVYETTWDAIATCDFDSDGRTDIVTSYSLLRNITEKRGDIQFGDRYPFTEGSSNYFVKDLNTDGKPDLLLSSGDYSPARIFINKSTPGNFSFDTAYSLIPFNDIVADDFDGDGRPEIVGIKNEFGGILTVYRNTSDSLFKVSPGLTFTVEGSASCTITEDFNNDNKKDIAVISNGDGGSGHISFFKNTSGKDEISFNLNFDISLQNNGPRGMASADFDGDGKKDMVVCYKYNNAMGLLKNVSTANEIKFELMGYQPMPYSKSFTDRGKCAVSDFNGDGKPDVVISNRYFVYVFKNISTPGNIKFEDYFTYTPGGHSSMLAVADFDNDGLPDIARKLTQDPDPKPLQIFRNVLDCARIDSLSPSSGAIGTHIKLYGRKFTGTSSVSIGGEPAANFTVINDTLIMATVGKLSSGRVLIYTPSGYCAIDSFTASNTLAESFGLSIKWQRTLGGTNDDEAYFVQQTLDEGFISVGYTKSNDGDIASKVGQSDMWIIKLNQEGDISWKTNFGNATFLGARKAIQLADSSYLVGGYDTSGNGNNGSNIWLVKLSPKGLVQWSKNFPALDTYEMVMQDIIATAEGGYLISALIVTTNTYKLLRLIKVTANGNITWDKTYNSYNYEDAELLQTEYNYWVGFTDDNFPEIAFLHKMAKTGEVTEEQGLGYPPRDARLQKIIHLKDDKILVAVKEHYDNPLMPALKADELLLYNCDSNIYIPWASGTYIAYTDTLYDIKQLSNDGFIGIGTRMQTDSISNLSHKKLWVIVFDLIGNAVWQQTLGGTGDNTGYSIDVCKDGGYIIAGSNTRDPDNKNTHGKKDYWIVKLTYVRQLKFCPPYGYAVLTSDRTGSAYQWQIDKGDGYSNFFDTAVNSETKQLALTIPVNYSGYRFRCLFDGQPSSEFLIKFENRWVGSISNDWFNPLNWNCNSLPDINSDVIIESGKVDISQDVFCKSLLIAAGAIVNVKPGVKIFVKP